MSEFSSVTKCDPKHKILVCLWLMLQPLWFSHIIPLTSLPYFTQMHPRHLWYVFHKDPYPHVPLNIHAEFTRISCCCKKSLEAITRSRSYWHIRVSLICPYSITRNCQNDRFLASESYCSGLDCCCPWLWTWIPVPLILILHAPHWNLAGHLALHCTHLIFSVIVFQNHPGANPNSALCPMRNGHHWAQLSP